MPVIRHEVEMEFRVRAAWAANRGFRSSAGTARRPTGARFEPWSCVGGLAAIVDFVGRSAAEGFVRPVGVVPGKGCGGEVEVGPRS